jgi:hypothetical protein
MSLKRFLKFNYINMEYIIHFIVKIIDFYFIFFILMNNFIILSFKFNFYNLISFFILIA